VSDVVVITEHVEQLLDIFASNPSYNSRAVFLLADDVVELMLKAYIRSWRHRNRGVLAEPSTFPQACLYTVMTWAGQAGLTTAGIKGHWEALETDPKRRWWGSHLTDVQNHSEYATIRGRRTEAVEAIESALAHHEQRNKLYHDPSSMRLGPVERTVCDAVANLLVLGRVLYPRKFESQLRSNPLAQALFAWFHLHRNRYVNGEIRTALESCFQTQPSHGLEKLRRFNHEEVGWAIVRDPDFGHNWVLMHQDSTTFAPVLEGAAIGHRLIKARTRRYPRPSTRRCSPTLSGWTNAA